jgi:hypothetical protein
MTRLEMPRGLKRRIHTAAVLAFACLALLPRGSRAEDAPAAADSAVDDDNDDVKPAAKPADAKPAADAKPDTAKPAPDAAAPVADTKTPVPAESTPAVKDEMDAAGYIPGYRKSMGLGVAPWVPRVGSVPGGFTPSFAAPCPAAGRT